jgi:hypothetical protein
MGGRGGMPCHGRLSDLVARMIRRTLYEASALALGVPLGVALALISIAIEKVRTWKLSD